MPADRETVTNKAVIYRQVSSKKQEELGGGLN